MSERVTVSVDGGVADVKLNRPDKMNALDQAMFRALVDTGRALGRERAVRAIVLSGEGRAFCAGLDFASFMAMRGDESSGSGGGAAAGDLLARRGEEPANFAQSAAWVWAAIPQPVIAAVHGVAFGGGLQIALGADIRIVAPDARFSVMEVKWGLVPDMSLTQTLRHVVRLDVAKELTFTGRIVSGHEAVELGLATRVADDPHAAAFELAREIAGKSPHAVRAGKRLLREAWVAPPAEGFALEESLQRTLIGSPNQIEAVAANLEKRAPSFRDPD
ncbi:MAG TPA: crotonase/enoyl-CoA hydratase family protein [Candidatus Binatia bacterium]|nr:crotonase/enoyl-CoA hydratase family protein [Candidatus Binatia bacterium]